VNALVLGLAEGAEPTRQGLPPAPRLTLGSSPGTPPALTRVTVMRRDQTRVIEGALAHEAPESSLTLPWTRAQLCGTTANAENIAMGQRSATEVMTGWTNSAEHNANMLNARLTRVGVGYEETGQYWGQLFGQSLLRHRGFGGYGGPSISVATISTPNPASPT
jgi:hypothetical protein